MGLDERTLGKRLQRARQASGLTQQALCQAANISYSTLAKIERGAIKAPSIFTVQAIAGAVGTSLDELVGSPAKVATPRHHSASGVGFVYFDLNDTLVRASERGFARLADESGVPTDLIETMFWQHNEALCRGKLPLDEFNASLSQRLGIKVDWLKTYVDAAEPIEPMQKLMVWASQYYPVGILTNTMPGLLDGLRQHGVLPEITYAAIVDSSQLGIAKPEPAIFQAAQAQAGVSASEIILIDDSRANLITAAEEGWHVAAADGYKMADTAKRLREALKPVD